MFENSQSTSGWQTTSKGKNNIWKWLTLAMITLLLIGSAVWFYLTPYLALHGIRTAAENRDAETFSSYIDFPVFKENLKSELSAKMMSEMSKNQDKMKDNPFAPLAMTFAANMVNSMIDGLVSPAGIERIMRGEFQMGNPQQQPIPVQNTNSKFPTEETHNIESGYDSFSKFSVDVAPKDKPENHVKLILERRGLFGWQVTNLKLP